MTKKFSIVKVNIIIIIQPSISQGPDHASKDVPHDEVKLKFNLHSFLDALHLEEAGGIVVCRKNTFSKDLTPCDLLKHVERQSLQVLSRRGSARNSGLKRKMVMRMTECTACAV